MIKQWIEKYDLQKFGRFIVTGGTATLIDFIIYMLIRVHIGTSWGKFISMLCANVFSFIANKKWTFGVERKVTVWMVLQYVFVQALNIGTNVLINAISLKLTNMVVLSFVIATGCAMIVNYLGQRFIVFKK